MFASNTSTLVLLAKISCLETFLQLAQPVVIPRQVKEEALFEKETYYARLINKLLMEGKITLGEADNNKIKKIMMVFRLDLGEAAAYSLFDFAKHNALLTDDGELIKLCRLERITFICTMAVVVGLYELNKLSKAEALEKLRILREIGRYSQSIYEHFK